jgi:hypothetical protein
MSEILNTAIDPEKISFFSKEQMRDFRIAVSSMMIGATLFFFGCGMYRPDYPVEINNMFRALVWMGFILIMASVCFATWKFRRGFFPMLTR